ncbi:YbaB/EbfC family nucleoid-associated protein [Streptosporangium sp. NBC_01639]|uniref:YbaB/EbfC family nucleoid-associated protein n=1 Tax=Streptosporangium sp. NBC_01639 TaxID=2975948 RepID=UPI00386BFE79|nr:YbaB/EbfC family nucleoid-associated protein [Streptosporangium sp. NBC_01639]
MTDVEPLGVRRMTPWPEDDHELLEQILKQSREAMGRLQEAEAAVRRVVGEGRGANDLIRVASDGRGGITEVRFDPRVMRLGRSALGKEVVAALQQAQSDAERQTQEIVGVALDGTATLPEPLDATFVRERVEQVARELLKGES